MKKSKFWELFLKDKYFPSQNKFELQNIIFWLKGYFNNKINSIIEVGTFRGGTLRFWREILDKDGILISVDLNDRGYMDEIKGMYKDDNRVKFVIGDSTSETTIKNVIDTLDKKQVDVLFIDANHLSEYVRKDYENYEKMVKSGGVIIFHDIVNTQIKPVWDELKKGKCYMEIWGDEHEPCGIGIIAKDWFSSEAVD